MYGSQKKTSRIHHLIEKKNENLIILHSRLTFLSEFLLILFTLSFLLLWNKKYCVLPALFHFVTLRLLSIPFKLLNWHCVKVFPSQSSSPSNTSVEIQFWFLTFGYRTSSCTHNHMSVRWKNQVKNESRRDWIFIFTLIVFLSLSLSPHSRDGSKLVFIEMKREKAVENVLSCFSAAAFVIMSDTDEWCVEKYGWIVSVEGEAEYKKKVCELSWTKLIYIGKVFNFPRSSSHGSRVLRAKAKPCNIVQQWLKDSLSCCCCSCPVKLSLSVCGCEK